MNRYPGIRPFRTEEQSLFFGRDADIERLHRLLDLEQIVILYGKSGYGKSSLLSAGIYPKLEAEQQYRHFEIRLGPYKNAESAAPAQNTINTLKSAVAPPDAFVADALFPAESSLWLAIKRLQSPANKRFILFFDQFEELFTYPPEQILEFKKQLAEALYSRVPNRLEKNIAAAALDPQTEDALYTPFELKVLFSIRSDRMSLLNGLKDYLPNLLQHTCELDALDEQQAERAMAEPAALPQTVTRHSETIRFDTPPFKYAPETIAAIFNALRDERGRIETSALQIVCKHVEDNIVTSGRWTADGGRPNQPITIGTADLGDLRSVFRNFYENTLDGLPAHEQDAARRLCEDVLISREGIRLPFAEQALVAQGFAPDLLERLARASLLRVERDDQGRMLYEIGHDTLVGPIAESALARREREEKERLRREAEEQRREKELAIAARRRARLVAAGAILLSLVAIGASFLAYLKSEQASEAAALVLQKEQQVAQKTAEADSLFVSVRKAEAGVDTAKARLALAETQTQTERQLARQNLAEAERASADVVRLLMENAHRSMLLLNYERALQLLRSAADLAAKATPGSPLHDTRSAVLDALLEPIYFYNETGQGALIQEDLRRIARLGSFNLSASGNTQRQALRDALNKLRPARFAFLEARYYPFMLPVKGGEFRPGCVKPADCLQDDDDGYRVRLSDFHIAESETTVWQYNLFLAAQGKNIFDDKNTMPRPSWGWEGNNPIVYVSWYDACLYANWASRQHGLDTVYAMTNRQERNETYYTDTYDVTEDSTANGFRLPTEAQWEYAARGGARQDTFLYAGSDTLERVGWYALNSGNRTNPVKQLRPNALGLYDMSGNVWEWCQDWYDSYPNGVFTDRRGPVSGSYRVPRGGSWGNSADYAHVADRYIYTPDLRGVDYGFRLSRAR
ncbi:MAG: SUMF1/EgtB/PvdO family nonheme iron enzyme [Saprospiraceae bacterium]|nr:SUMF1/EgtB/PvdO family nonheme iron enzyme [Saprospiraceae bacterium]